MNKEFVNGNKKTLIEFIARMEHRHYLQMKAFYCEDNEEQKKTIKIEIQNSQTLYNKLSKEEKEMFQFEALRIIHFINQWNSETPDKLFMSEIEDYVRNV